MLYHPIAQVMNNRLTPLAASGDEPITVGTKTWYTWLNAYETRSFSYHTSDGALTARRESRHGRWYWYAYRARKGKLYKVYLGKAEELSQQRLDNAIRQLTDSQTLQPPVQESKDAPVLPEARSPLLKTKLVSPPFPEYLVTRSRLLHVLQKGAVSTLTLVCAPAGFGKTTLLCEWVAQSRRPCAWFSLDDEDNDPHRFLAYLLGAFQQVHPHFPSISFSSQSMPLEIIISILNELASLPGEVTLILDDYQVIKNQAIHRMLTFALEHMPSHVHFVIASRGEPPCVLARLRASGRVSGLDANALRFTREEVKTLLTSMMKLPLKPEEIATLEERTEGWVAALHLVKFALQGQRDSSRFITTFGGSNRYILAYLLEEVFEQQPEHIQAFFLHTALLESFNSSLCCAMTDREDAESILEYLEDANLFLFPCEEHAGWYRYHALFAEAMRYHLGRTHPEFLLVLHARASRWFETHGLMEEAIKHALAAHDSERTVALIEQVAPAFFAQGKITVVQGWLASLPEMVVHGSLHLCIIAAWMMFITSQVDRFLFFVEAAEQALHREQASLPLTTVPVLQAEIVALRAIYVLSSNDYASAIAICRQALQELPPESLYPRGFVLLILGLAYSRGKNVDAGVQIIAEASSYIQATGHALLLPYGITIQAELYMMRGNSSQAEKLYRQILMLATGQDVLSVFVAGRAHVGLGCLFWEWNNLEAARQHLLQAWELGMQTQAATTLALSALFLVLVLQAQGKRDAVDFWLQQGETICQRVKHVESLNVMAACRARLSLAEGQVEEALLWMHECHEALEDSTSKRSDFEKLTLVRVLITAERINADGSFVQRALSLVERLRVTAEAAGRVRIVVETLILQTLALQLQGDSAGALGTLASAVALAEPGRYIRLFVGEGDPMARLLRRLLEQQRAQKAFGQTISFIYLSNLLKAFTNPEASSLPTSPTKGQPLLDPLSLREREVLGLIAAGRKNREIADELVVVIGTVKAHINTIYQKLGVANRIQAVARARTLGLL